MQFTKTVADKMLDAGLKALLTDRIFLLSFALLFRTIEPLKAADAIFCSLTREDSSLCPNKMLRFTAISRISKIRKKYYTLTL